MSQELFLQKGYNVNDLGHLTLRDVDLYRICSLVGDEPIHVLDEMQIKQNIQIYQKVLKEFYPNQSKIFYASKANQNLAICKLIEQQNICLDVCSLGEMHVAKKGNFPFKDMLLHGNNKSEKEILFALENNIGYIVIDNLSEYDLLSKICQEKGQIANIMIRINPNQSATTHKYIDTATGECQFGIVSEDELIHLAQQIQSNPNVEFNGLHIHLGSQLSQTEEVCDILKKFVYYCKIFNDHNLECKYINIGGGKSIQYEYKVPILGIYDSMKIILESLVNEIKKQNLPIPKLMIEPGRSIIGDAGCSLYKVGAIKTLSKGNQCASVNGGMSDNIRPSLYGAKYYAMDPARPFWTGATINYKIVGKCCESGDILIQNIDLPEITRNDYLVFFSTGAYVESMSSRYNKHISGGTILIHESGYDWIVKPQNLDELVTNDLIPKHLYSKNLSKQ